MSFFDWFLKFRGNKDSSSEQENAGLSINEPRLGYNAEFATSTYAIRKRLVEAGFEPQSLSLLDDQMLMDIFEELDLTDGEVEMMDSEQLREAFENVESMPLTPLAQLFNEFAYVGIDEFEFEVMDEYERRQAIEDAGFDPDDFPELLEYE